MTEQDAPPAQPEPQRWAGGSILADALIVSVIGAVFWGALESGAVAVLASDRFVGGIPWGLVFAGLGKAALTHLLFWTIPFLLIGLALCRGRFAAAPRRMALLTGVYFFVTGLTIGWADLLMLNRGSMVMLMLLVIGVVVLSGGAYFLQVAMAQRMGETFIRRAAASKALVAVVVLGLAVAALFRSPFGLPDRYRVAGPAEGAQAAPRSVLWIVLDTVRADRLSVYGHDQPTTPYLEQLAGESLVFERVVTPGIWTVPGHATMFTGLSTREHGADLPGRWLDDEKQTIAEALQAHGYTTAGFSNNPWISTHTNLVQGFEHFVNLNHYRHLGRFSLEYLLDRFGFAPPLPWLDGDYGAALTNRMVAEWLDQQPADKPMMVFVNYMEAHLPYRVPRRYREMFMTPGQATRSYALRKSVYGEIADVLHYTFNIEGADFVSAEDCDILAGQYDAGIRYLDDRVRELVELFDSRGAPPLVIITADHGEYLDEHGMWGHTFLAYEGVARVPLLIRAPGKPGRRVSGITRLADLFPTVLQYAGAQPGKVGHDTRDLLADVQIQAQRLAVTWWSGAEEKLRKRIAKQQDPEVHHRGRGQVAIQDGLWKLMLSDDGRAELFNLQDDPGELRNLAGEAAAERERLLAAWEQWQQLVPLYTSSRTVPGRMSPEMRRQMEAIGYGGGSDEDDEYEDESDAD